MATLYFHIPFCKRICSYCDFYRVGAVQLLPDVVGQMHRELRERATYLKERRLTSIYFGGGTPSLLAPDDIEALISRARELFDCSAVEEITIEANPDDLTDDYVARLARTSVNRVSLGIQSFDDEALRLMNRRHSAEEAEEAVRRLQRAGICNISIDIIFGIAGFGGESLDATLRRALALGVGHISAYHLTIEPRTRLGIMCQKGEYEPIYISAPECQVLDNENHPDARLGKDGNRMSTSLYDMIPAKPQNAKPAGEWNKVKIMVYKGTVVHYQNDEPVVEYHLWTPQWTEMLQASKFSQEKWPVAFELLNNCGGENHEGYIGFQDHGDDVWFRNIKVTILD